MAKSVTQNTNTVHMNQGEEISPGVFEKFAHPKNWIRDRIKIFQQEGPGGSDPVYVSVNGYSILIPRETECDVARPFVEVLRNSVQSAEEQDKDGNPVMRDIRRFNWTLLKEGVNLKPDGTVEEYKGDNT